MSDDTDQREVVDVKDLFVVLKCCLFSSPKDGNASVDW